MVIPRQELVFLSQIEEVLLKLNRVLPLNLLGPLKLRVLFLVKRCNFQRLLKRCLEENVVFFEPRHLLPPFIQHFLGFSSSFRQRVVGGLQVLDLFVLLLEDCFLAENDVVMLGEFPFEVLVFFLDDLPVLLHFPLVMRLDFQHLLLEDLRVFLSYFCHLFQFANELLFLLLSLLLEAVYLLGQLI